MLEQRIEQDLKTALLGGNKTLATTLRGLKSVILYAKVAKGARQEPLSDDELIELLAKEAKKRQESADLYRRGGNEERAEAELTEKTAIESYLPQQMTDEELLQVIDQVMGQIGSSQQVMGQIINAVKQQTQGKADGGRIAQAVKARLL